MRVLRVRSFLASPATLHPRDPRPQSQTRDAPRAPRPQISFPPQPSRRSPAHQISENSLASSLRRNVATANMCSVCYKSTHMSKQETSTPTAAAPSPEPSVAHPSPAPAPAPSPATAASEASVDGSRAEASSSAAAAGDVPGDGSGDAPPVKQANPNRCYSCNKRVGFTGFECRCGFTYCATHRHANKHECSFDFKAMGRDAVAKANPAVIAEKVDKVRYFTRDDTTRSSERDGEFSSVPRTRKTDPFTLVSSQI